MKMLNSILIEGKLVEGRTRVGNSLQFLIEQPQELHTAKQLFKCVAQGTLAECIEENIKYKGKLSLRLVGHLERGTWYDVEGEPYDEIFIIVEHIEVKSV